MGREEKSNSTRQANAGGRNCDPRMNGKEMKMNAWFYYALGAAVLYGMHQVFTNLAAEHISDGLGGFVVEATAAATILLYLAALRFAGNWNQIASAPGVWYSVLTG